jgi:hypothetical protein
VVEADSDGACLNIWRQRGRDWRWCQQLTFSFIPPQFLSDALQRLGQIEQGKKEIE